MDPCIVSSYNWIESFSNLSEKARTQNSYVEIDDHSFFHAYWILWKDRIDQHLKESKSGFQIPRNYVAFFFLD